MMAEQFPEDRLTTLTQEYRAKFNDFPPRHALHADDPEGEIEKAIKAGKRIPEVIPGNTKRDTQ